MVTMIDCATVKVRKEPIMTNCAVRFDTQAEAHYSDSHAEQTSKYSRVQVPHCKHQDDGIIVVI